MPDMHTHTLYIAIFALQIFTLSILLPAILVRKMRFVFAQYPQHTYPKLYPLSQAYMTKAVVVFTALAGVNCLIGIGLIALMINNLAEVSQRSNVEFRWLFDEMLPFYYYALQILPFLLAEFFGFKMLKIMRTLRTDHQRTAELRPRRLDDFVSKPTKIISLISFLALTLTVLLLYSQPGQSIGKAFIFLAMLSAGNLFFGAIIYWNIYYRNQDPFASKAARENSMTSTVTSLFYMSTAMSLYCILIAINDVLFENLGSAVLVSIFLQIVMVLSIGAQLSALRLKDTDYEAYR
jgi:hypothetical protein